jgi:hypothetical protein
MTDDQIVIGVCGLLATGLAFLGIRLILRKRRLLAAMAFLAVIPLLGVLWFFATFQMRLM